jgi:hypothetical protein
MGLRLAVTALAAALTLGAASSAPAQTVPGQTPDPPVVCCTPPPVVPKPKDGRMRLKLLSGLRQGSKRYLAAGQRVKVIGRARPFVAGQYVQVRVRNAGRTIKVKRMRLRRARGGRAKFLVRFTVRRRGRVTVVARHAKTKRQKAFKASEHTKAFDPRAGYGSRGLRVRLLQRGLRRLGYAGLRADGYYGPGTGRAVLAFRKVNKLPRLTYANAIVFKRVFERRGTYRLKYPNAGRHVEANLARQVLVLARDGRAARIYHMSSGKPSTPTILGSFRFYRKSPGTNSHGMVHSSYFIGGYAVHGYQSVPTYAASHGCLRVPIPDAWTIYDWIDYDDQIFVYR